MTGMTKLEVEDYLASLGKLGEDRLHYGDGRLYFKGADVASIHVHYPKEPYRLMYLARLLGSLMHKESHFLHGLVWVSTWGVWDIGVEAIGLKMFERMRQSKGENRPLESAPGTWFRHDELVDAVSILVQPMLVGWDAYYVPQWAAGGDEYFVSVSHDSYIDVHTRTKETNERARDLLKDFDTDACRKSAD